MFPAPRADVTPNTTAFETVPLIDPLGFREYDARWLYPEQINLLGAQRVGLALGHELRDRHGKTSIIVGHDYRSYSGALKQALVIGLLAAGCDVFDIGLALTPMAYFAQVELGVGGVAMVTASHNENGWTGIKMGANAPLTFGPEEMDALRKRALTGSLAPADRSGRYALVPGMRERYTADLIAQGGIGRPLKAVCACGNGTAGLFAPAVLEGIGCEVVPLHCTLDWTFPHHNPNPEDVGMLRALGDAVRGSGADIGLAFDGDGDRCGVVDETGAEIFADKMGLLLARDLARSAPDALFLADVKSTGLFRDDPVLRAHGARFEMIRTGHSYMKRALRDRGALAAFEKSGHYVFGPPIGRGYDDGLLSAVAICRFLDRHPGARLSEMRQALPQTWLSPTMAPYCPDDRKYAVVEEIARYYADLAARNQTVLGLAIREVVTTNGIRIEIADGSWGLVRASSNKPSLVVVVESPVSEARMRAMFAELDARLRRFPEIGAYDQKL